MQVLFFQLGLNFFCKILNQLGNCIHMTFFFLNLLDDPVNCRFHLFAGKMPGEDFLFQAEYSKLFLQMFKLAAKGKTIQSIGQKNSNCRFPAKSCHHMSHPPPPGFSNHQYRRGSKMGQSSTNRNIDKQQP